MELTKELEIAISNGLGNMQGIEVYYDSEQISGFVKRVSHMPFEVIVCKTVTPRGENSYHDLDFYKATKIELKFYDGTTKTFE